MTETLHLVASRHNVGIIRADENFHDGDRVRDIYTTFNASGSDQTTRVEDLLTPFGRAPTLQLNFREFESNHPLDPRAAYLVLGSTVAAEELQTQFEKLGLHGSLAHSFSFEAVFLNYALRNIELVTGLLAGFSTVTIGSVLLSARRFAVLRLHGVSNIQIVRRDARAVGPFLATAILTSGATTLIFLYWYNRWTQLWAFTYLTAVALTFIGLFVILAYTLTLLATSATSIPNTLQGKMRLAPILAVVYPTRILSTLLVATAAAGVIDSHAGINNREAALSHHADTINAVNITFPGHRTPEESDRSFEEAGAWIRQLDIRGKAILMKRDYLQDGLPASIPVGQTELMTVNDTFLSQQPVYDLQRKRIGPTPEGTVRIIIPEKFTPYADAITANVLRSVSPEALPTGVAQPHSQRLVAVNNQTLFSYALKNQDQNSDGSAINRPMVHDAVIVTFPNGSPLNSNSSLAAWASQGGLVTSPSEVLSSIGRDLPTHSILGMLPLAGILTDNYSAEVQRLILNSAVLALAVSGLTLTVATSYLLYSQKNRQTIASGHVAGHGFLRIHRRSLALEGGALCGVTFWICLDNWNRALAGAVYTNNGIPLPPSAPPPDWWRLLPATAASLAGTMLFFTLLLLVHRHGAATAPKRKIPRAGEVAA